MSPGQMANRANVSTRTNVIDRYFHRGLDSFILLNQPNLTSNIPPPNILIIPRNSPPNNIRILEDIHLAGGGYLSTTVLILILPYYWSYVATPCFIILERLRELIRFGNSENFLHLPLHLH